MSDIREDNLEVQRAWNTNAAFWDSRMADGNEFFNHLIWPAVESLLEPSPGQSILDIACGNGVTSRRLAKAGAVVTAIDFSGPLIEFARKRSPAEKIQYRVMDATDCEALTGLGRRSFDSALCNMAMMDMAEIEPMMRAVGECLRPDGRFVFSILHPCFNNPDVVLTEEREDRDGQLIDSYSVRVRRYATSFKKAGVAIDGQPQPQPYFHRSLETLLNAAFGAGLVLDGWNESVFPPGYSGAGPTLGWSRFSEIPPVLVARLRVNR
jgi:2-polyprenyl-3-methyl-5-hydroxy-6-metoxy-1,4-benzoquinol methylase